ncbi:hypothetical protein IB677_02465 [Francisella adeliensis]|nr:hypothetical protein [Francisella adeliensis]
MSIYLSFFQLAWLIFSLTFAIKIIDFRRSAWVFYFLATFIGFISFSVFNNPSISNIFNNLMIFFPDLALPILAIIIANKSNISPKKITSDSILQASIIIILTVILMLFFTYINLAIAPTYNILMLISDFFGILVYVGSVLLAFGYISGLLLNAISSIQMACMNIYFSISFNFYSSTLYVTVAINILCFTIFIYGYNKNKKLLSH